MKKLPLRILSFLVFLYHFLIRHLHRLIAGLFLVFFICIPEMYAYTFMVLYDYSNAVFFCVAVLADRSSVAWVPQYFLLGLGPVLGHLCGRTHFRNPCAPPGIVDGPVWDCGDRVARSIRQCIMAQGHENFSAVAEFAADMEKSRRRVGG